jgi:hypothetical protein
MIDLVAQRVVQAAPLYDTTLADDKRPQRAGLVGREE